MNVILDNDITVTVKAIARKIPNSIGMRNKCRLKKITYPYQNR